MGLQHQVPIGNFRGNFREPFFSSLHVSISIFPDFPTDFFIKLFSFSQRFLINPISSWGVQLRAPVHPVQRLCNLVQPLNNLVQSYCNLVVGRIPSQGQCWFHTFSQFSYSVPSRVPFMFVGYVLPLGVSLCFYVVLKSNFNLCLMSHYSMLIFFIKVFPSFNLRFQIQCLGFA